MKKLINLLSEKYQELKNNDEYKFAALSGYTSGVLLVVIICGGGGAAAACVGEKAVGKCPHQM